MNLYILRHGVAVERGTNGYKSDAERPLTPKGRRKLRRAVAAMRVMELSFDVILSSPLVRARETAEIVGKGLHLQKKLKLTEHLASGGKSAGLVQYLVELEPKLEDVLLVGHEPDLGQLASLLLTGSSSTLQVTFKKGGLCKLTVGRLRAGKCASLEWLLTPSQLELIG